MAESEVGEWAKDKLDRLRKYLNAYTIIMRRQKWCEAFYYIDAFAGPGEHAIRRRRRRRRRPRSVAQSLLSEEQFTYKDEGQQEFLAGSPRVALDLVHPFTHYVFVEKSEARVSALEQLQAEYGSTRRIQIHHCDCTHYLKDEVAKNPAIDWQCNRAVVFLDPFGMQVGWKTIAILAETKAIDVFLNFPVGMAIQRLLVRDPEKLSPRRRKKLDEFFGAPGWYDVLYKKQQSALFGGEQEEKVDRSGKALVQWYRNQLLSVFGHVSHAALFRNTRGGHLYYLLLASHNATGVKIANDILSAGETIE